MEAALGERRVRTCLRRQANPRFVSFFCRYDSYSPTVHDLPTRRDSLGRVLLAVDLAPPPSLSAAAAEMTSPKSMHSASQASPGFGRSGSTFSHMSPSHREEDHEPDDGDTLEPAIKTILKMAPNTRETQHVDLIVDCITKYGADFITPFSDEQILEIAKTAEYKFFPVGSQICAMDEETE